MRRLSLSRAFLLLVLILMLWVPAAQAGESRPEAKSERGFVAWDFLDQVWESLTRIWAANGCILDPHGGCVPDQGTAAPESDNGCRLDPHGGCAS
jgi:hypothetical protein